MNEYKKQFYPPQNTSDTWKLNNNIKKGVLLPSKEHVLSIYTLIYNLIEKNSVEIDVRKKEFDDKSKDTYNIKKYLWSIFSDESVEFRDKDLLVDFVKGSIYKIKQYFMESSNIREIRGGSRIIDYLNIDFVEKQLNNLGLNKSNIIYCGGGNILLVVPKGKGKEVCSFFEKQYKEITLTMKSAFVYKETTIDGFIKNYNCIRDEIDNLVRERSNVKFYNTNYDNALNDLNLEGLCNLNLSKYLIKDNTQRVCKSCDLRDAKYYIEEEADRPYLCPSCTRKHLLGKYLEKSLGLKGSLDDIFDKEDIAIIYGDGNNMGNVVDNIENVFEMMYFSNRTDEITTEAVDKALIQDGEKIPSVKIAVGGDDIFIIVPANKCFNVVYDIIHHFDEAFNNRITMSVGIAITKTDTPITSTFEIAHSRLVKAKALVKQNSLEEGSVDVIELTGEFHLDIDDKNREFPMSMTKLKVFMDKMKDAKKENSRLNSQLNKLNYAHKTMIEDEFNLFYLYQKSKDRGYSVSSLIKDIYQDINKNEKIRNDEDKEKMYNQYKINWDDILLMWKRM